MIRDLIRHLLVPDDYPDDWYRWMGGQAGHAAIIGGPMALMLLAMGWPPGLAIITVAAIYGLLWEILIQRGPDWRDNLADTAHTMAGASLVSAPFGFIAPGDRLTAVAVMGAIYLCWLLALAAGIINRMRGKRDG